MALPPGAVVGGYRLERVLGSGGMGAVYLGRHPSLPRQDAIKILNEQLSSDPEFRARFQREANLAAGLDHPNIVSVFNRGEEHGRLWIAMQYVPGTDASQEAQQNPGSMTPQRVLRIISEVGKGLDYAHRRRLLHRDIKPANFLLSNSPDDDEERVLLTDFGVAKSVEDGQDLTATGKFMATVAYASPEQLLGQHLDHRSDIYSLGCSMFRLLTGQNPYPSTVPAVVMMGHLNEAPPNISGVRRDLPPALDRVFAKVLAKDPQDRYNTCREFVADAAAALSGQPPAQTPVGRLDPVDSGRYPSQPAFPADSATVRDRARRGEEFIATLPRDNFEAAFPKAAKKNMLRRVLVATAAAVVVVIAVAAAFLVRSDGGSGSPGGADLAQVRSDHPEFAGKTVAAFNYGNSLFSVALDGSPQTDFLHDIGFRYSDEYIPADANEKSPRELSTTSFDLNGQHDVLIVLRSDSDAGNGGLGGLPPAFLRTSTKIVVIDDISAVQAFQVWTPQSPEILAEKMVPEISEILS
ncbi:serine/threonine-protein kinase [Nocardia sp. NPDC019395]|uniref:serine/threonine-protein kinase n=1 Tax=Nocardia sp. NPDC019395 TaxID=3154686 RepID=UPI0033DCEC2B